MSIREFFANRRAVADFKALDKKFHNLVFYSEGSGDWPHLGPIVEELLEKPGVHLSYLTSDAGDPGLHLANSRFRAFNIGSGTMRTVLFRGIECKNFVMTLPDLETFHLKRSVHPVHYVYLFHSINSTHTVYRKGAFDAYDTIFCVGPHHEAEIRQTEKVYGLKAKRLVAHGSAKLDTVMRQFQGLQGNSVSGRVLLAPSWGECSFIESATGERLIQSLLDDGLEVILRLHPMTPRRLPKLVPSLKARFAANPKFTVEENMNALQSWMTSECMVTDWSGAGIEYAFALGRPVFYVDTPQKINNPEWQRIGMRGAEDQIRGKIGSVIAPDRVEELPARIRNFILNADKINSVRDAWVFNAGRSSRVAADELAKFL